MSGPIFVCHGCGATVDGARVCRSAARTPARGDDIDHVLVAADGGGAIAERKRDPFLRYRAAVALSPGARPACRTPPGARSSGARRRLIAVDGRGFRVTPMAPQPALAGRWDERQPVGQGRDPQCRRLAQGAPPHGRDALSARARGRQAARRRGLARAPAGDRVLRQCRARRRGDRARRRLAARGVHSARRR